VAILDFAESEVTQEPSMHADICRKHRKMEPDEIPPWAEMDWPEWDCEMDCDGYKTCPMGGGR